MRSLRVVVRGVLSQHAAEVPLAEDQHAVGEFGANGQYEAFGETVRPWTTGWDLDHLDARIGEHRVKRGRELSGPIADEEPAPPDVFAEVHHEVAGLLGGPGPVGMSGHAEDVQVAVVDLDHEQGVEPPQGYRAVDVEEVDREHAGGLGAQELPPARIGLSQWRWRDPVTLQDPPDRRGTDAVAELEQLALPSCIPSSGSPAPSGRPVRRGRR
jgi:hypothetical protein